jgi:hypothetical protein
MGIVLPDGILGNPGDEYIRYWILRHCWVLASIDLPVESFIVEANVNILTSLLFLKKKPTQEIQAGDLGKKQDYPVFMAVAEKVGFDRRGNTLYKRHRTAKKSSSTRPTKRRCASAAGWKCAPCTARSASSTTTCRTSPPPTRNSAPGIRSPGSDHAAGSDPLPLL